MDPLVRTSYKHSSDGFDRFEQPLWCSLEPRLVQISGRLFGAELALRTIDFEIPLRCVKACR
jgi:hypothetical protein